jgi:hypothetical protein
MKTKLKLILIFFIFIQINKGEWMCFIYVLKNYVFNLVLSSFLYSETLRLCQSRDFA